MELSAYEECSELMSFYEVYCSKERGIIEGNTGGVLVIVLTAVIGFCPAKILERQQ